MESTWAGRSWIPPDWLRTVGRSLRGVRAGISSLACNDRRIAAVPDVIRVTSPVFGPGQDMPARLTRDGANLSPPLRWEGLPEGTRSLVLLIEDPDIPLPMPFVHGLFYGIRPEMEGLSEGALPLRLNGPSPEGFFAGRNGFGRPGWTAPTPPPGHGPHHCAFEIFALDNAPRFDWPPGKAYLLRTVRLNMVGRGVLFGVYERV
jgi:Raf kinase inhibitor-like YbhB/YbcL family protein